MIKYVSVFTPVEPLWKVGVTDGLLVLRSCKKSGDTDSHSEAEMIRDWFCVQNGQWNWCKQTWVTHIEPYTIFVSSCLVTVVYTVNVTQWREQTTVEDQSSCGWDFTLDWYRQCCLLPQQKVPGNQWGGINTCNILVQTSSEWLLFSLYSAVLHHLPGC